MAKQVFARKTMITKANSITKGFVYLLIVAIIGLFAGLFYVDAHQKTVSAERNKVVDEKAQYLSKLSECSEVVKTTSSIINSAGLSECGVDMAIESLSLVSLNDIYYSYCREGFGVEVYGCTYLSSGKVYVCSPGTFAYERKYKYSTRRYTYYDVTSYSCSESQSKNTIRHELLHLVYSDLSNEERVKANKALSSYRDLYNEQLQVYSIADRDEELFVRVGADGRYVSDIELVDLYSKVSSTYITQKQDYYADQVKITNESINKYDVLSKKYAAFCVLFIAYIIINAVILFGIIVNGLNRYAIMPSSATRRVL